MVPRLLNIFKRKRGGGKRGSEIVYSEAYGHFQSLIFSKPVYRISIDSLYHNRVAINVRLSFFYLSSPPDGQPKHTNIQ